MEKRIKGSCTTILVGKKASIDGSTIISRNDDGHEALDPERLVVVNPADQPGTISPSLVRSKSTYLTIPYGILQFPTQS